MKLEKNKSKAVSPARAAAFRVLLRIEEEHSYSSVLLPIYAEKLSQQDRSLLYELVLGTLRRQLFLDRLIDVLTEDRKLDTAVRVVLRLALFQIRWMDRLPIHAIVNDSVNTIREAGKDSARGFVNAILRRAVREAAEPVFEDEIDRCSVETSMPRWLLERWIETFGPERAIAIAEASNRKPKTAFRLTPKAQWVPDETLKVLLHEELERACQSAVAASAFVIERSNERLRRLAAEGLIYFQDEGSQLVGSCIRVGPKEAFLDLCAAPGGKISQIAATEGTSKAFFVAGDRYEARIRTLRENCDRQGLSNIRFVCYNAEEMMPFRGGTFDAVLVDAPCSGTGTIRHNPELRYFLTASDIPQLAQKQLRILRNASKLVKPGGRLVYSTCSLENEENDEVINSFLNGDRDFEAVAPGISERFLYESVFARTFPDVDDSDGFFIAELRHR